MSVLSGFDLVWPLRWGCGRRAALAVNRLLMVEGAGFGDQAGGSSLYPGQVHAQVVGGPAVPCWEGLGFGGLGVPHDAGPIIVGLEGHDPIVPHPEPLPPPGKVDGLGREAQHPGVGVDCLLPLYGSAAEGAGRVLETPGDPDAEAAGRAATLPPDHGLQVVNSLDYPDELFRLHQVEGDVAARQLPLGDDALGGVPDHRGLHQTGLGAVLVQVLLSQGEIVRVLGQGVLLV